MARKAVSAPGPVSIPNSDLFETFGGAVKCLELSTALYARVGRDPALRHLFPGKSHRCAIEEFSAFLAQFLGGRPRTRDADGGLAFRNRITGFRSDRTSGTRGWDT